MVEISKCFLCSSPWAAQERVFIFGNSTHNFVEIIKSSLDFDISCYANSKLFICKAVCYKRLLKFERATEKVLELKREILESFQGRPRTKRLFNASMMSVESKVSCRFVEFDTSIICHVLVYCFGSFLLQDISLSLHEFAFEGQNMTFTMNVLFTCIIYCDAGPGYD